MAYKIVAATGCPTGIAHTYMAKEALEKAAKEAGVSIKVETHGQVGVENPLTEEEIRDAEVVIIASDKDVRPERFAGKRLIETSVSQGVKNAKGLVADALAGKGEIYAVKGSQAAQRAQSDAPSAAAGGSGNIGHAIYRHLMNGVTHMLPFVVGGGVLIAVSFLFGIYSANPDHEQYNKFAATLMQIGGASMGLMVPILSAFIAESIAKRPGLVAGFVGGVIANTGGTGFLGGIVSGFLAGGIILLLAKPFDKLPDSLRGLKAIFLFPVCGVFLTGIIMVLLSGPMSAINTSMMGWLQGFQSSSPIILGIIVGCMSAFDMGGPVNKAAYVTGTFLLGQGNYFFMAGVSAACIAPPLVTGVAVILFKKYFDSSDYNAGLVNIILGCTHITEGAIPFAAKDPIRVLPTLMLASSVAAVLTYMFKVQVPAPHGGFLVLPVTTNGLMWVLSILIGAVVGGVILGLIQKSRYLKEQANAA